MSDMLEQIAADLVPDEQSPPVLTREELFDESTFSYILSASDLYTRTKLLNQCRERAKELKCRRAFDENFAAYRKSVNDVGKIGLGTGISHFPPGKSPVKTGNWTANCDGVFRIRSLPGGEEIEEYASPIPIMPTAVYTNADTGVEKVELSYYTKQGWRSAIFDHSVIASAAKIVSTSDQGTEATSENAKLLVKYLSDCLKENRETLPYSTSVSHVGWYGGKFIPYSGDIAFDGDREYKTIFDAIKTKGDFEAWRRYVRELRKNIYVRLQMGASFASPLLSKIGALPFVLHLWGGTEAGKTVGLMVAMSVWGDPAMGKMLRTMNMTANSIMATASMLRDIPFAGDELQIIKERTGNYDKLIMSVCEGVDRGRMSYDKVNEMKSWNCAFLFTGEEPVTRSSSGGGAKNRVIEIECKEKVVENGKDTANFVRRNYGHAGREFIRYVTQMDGDLNRIYQQILTKLEKIDCTDKQRLSMAAILLGDTIGSISLFGDEKPLEAEDVQRFLKSRAEVDTAERAYDYIKDVVAINDARFCPNSYGDMSGEIWGRIDVDINEDKTETRRAYINKTQLVKMLRSEGYEFDAIKAKWADKGYLVRNSQGKMLHQTKCHGIKGTYVIVNL